MIKMNEWKATECHTEDHFGASIVMKLSPRDNAADVVVSGYTQSIGPNTALRMAAWLIAYALQAKGLNSDAISFVVKHK